MTSITTSTVFIFSAVCGVTATAIMLAIRRLRSRSIKKCLFSKNLSGKNVLITGANAGLGAEFAYEMAKRSANVHLACRSRASAQAAMERVEQRCMASDGVSVMNNLKYWPLDLLDLNSVIDLSTSLHKELGCIDILMNNAGIMNHPKAETKNNIEIHFGVNHLGHFLLTNLLLDLLKEAPDGGRVCIVSSAYHLKAKGPCHDYSHPDAYVNYHGLQAYANSKLANALHTFELARREPGLKVYCIRPGFVNTELGRHFAAAFRILAYPLIWTFAKTVEEGVQTYLHCAMADNLESGALYNNCEVERWNETLVNEAAAQSLWELSEQIIAQKLPESRLHPTIERKKSSNESSSNEEWVKT